jgi:serine/threonine protein kinase
VAVKILEKKRINDKSDMLRIKLEIKILKSSKHPSIIELHDIIETEKYIYLIMEYASGGELFDYIVSKNQLSEKESSTFFK